MNTFYHGDCLFVMRHDIPPESVDLIYLDPPFFTGKVQKGTAKWQPGAMEVSYEDSKRFWGDTEKVSRMRQQSPEWLKHIAKTRPDFASYLFYMMERLQACHKVLKATGSIYLHCDWRASHYLKMIMDEDKMFGHNNFRNEIVWFYPDSPGRSTKDFPSKHDIIYRYVKSTKWIFNESTIRIPILEASVQRYKSPRVLGGRTYIGGEAAIIGKVPEDVWRLPVVKHNSEEAQGYPTQKPLALLERIIKASSNEGDVVLDPFCGCGTAIVAAQRLKRQWIGIDISRDAYEISSKRQGELPLEFTHFQYVTRNLDEVQHLNPRDFEVWVNEYYKATKPSPDRGVDGITSDGIPIQTKAFQVKYNVVQQFVSAAKSHPLVRQPLSKIRLVSQVGFDDSARQEQDNVQSREGIEVDLVTPQEMLTIEDSLVLQ